MGHKRLKNDKNRINKIFLNFMFYAIFDAFSLLITLKSINIRLNEKIIGPMERGGNFVSDNVILIGRKRVFIIFIDF